MKHEHCKSYNEHEQEMYYIIEHKFSYEWNQKIKHKQGQKRKKSLHEHNYVTSTCPPSFINSKKREKNSHS